MAVTTIAEIIRGAVNQSQRRILSNFPAIPNDLQLTEEFFVGLASHVLGALGELRRSLVIDSKLPCNLISTPESTIDPVLILAVIDEFAAVAAAETAGVSVELVDAASASIARADQVRHRTANAAWTADDVEGFPRLVAVSRP